MPSCPFPQSETEMVLRGPAIDLVTFRWTLLTRKSSIQRRLCNHITLLVIDEVRCTAHVLYQHLYSPDNDILNIFIH